MKEEEEKEAERAEGGSVAVKEAVTEEESGEVTEEAERVEDKVEEVKEVVVNEEVKEVMAEEEETKGEEMEEVEDSLVDLVLKMKCNIY